MDSSVSAAWARVWRSGCSRSDIRFGSSIAPRLAPLGFARRARIASQRREKQLGAVQIASLAEAMALGERAGLDPQLLAEASGTGQAASPQVIRNSVRMARGDHDQSVVFTPELRLKDVEYALALARKLGMGTPFGTIAGEMFQKLCQSGRARVNESAVIEAARLRSPS